MTISMTAELSRKWTFQSRSPRRLDMPESTWLAGSGASVEKSSRFARSGAAWLPTRSATARLFEKAFL